MGASAKAKLNPISELKYFSELGPELGTCWTELRTAKDWAKDHFWAKDPNSYYILPEPLLIYLFKHYRLNFYDNDQKRVIEAALDDKKPFIVAYGPKGEARLKMSKRLNWLNRLIEIAGTGKTCIAAEVAKKARLFDFFK